MPVTKWVVEVAVAGRKAVSSTPRPRTSATRVGSSTTGSPNSRTARMTVCQPTPSVRASSLTVRPYRPTCSKAHLRARSVSTARGRIAADRSVQLACGQPGSRQIHTRWCHNSTTGRPAMGRSRTRCGRRSFAVATTPHRGQPVLPSVVSTTRSSSPPSSATATTAKPGRPSSATSGEPELTCELTWGSRSSCTWSSRIVKPQARLQPEPDDRVVGSLPMIMAES